MVQKRLIANVASMGLWQIGNYLIPLITFPYLTRILGVRAFGEFGFAFAIATYLVLITDWGFSLSANGAVARNREDKAALTIIFWNTLAAKSLLAVACVTILAVIIVIVAPPLSLAIALLAASLNVFSNVLTVNWCLQGLERMGLFAIAATGGRLLTIPAVFLLVAGPQDAWIAALINVCGAAIGGAISLIMVARLRVVGAPSITVRDMRAQMADGWHLFLSTISASFYTTTNTVILGLIAGPSAVGIYAAADRLRAAAQGVINPISQALYPHSTRLMQQDADAGLRFARKLLLLQGALCFCISAALFFGAPLLIALFAGPDYAGSVLVMRLLAPLPFLVGIGNVLGVQIMVPRGLKAGFSKVLSTVAILNIGIVVPLAFRYGATGTAIAAVFAEVMVVALMGWTLSKAGIRIIGEERRGYGI